MSAWQGFSGSRAIPDYSLIGPPADVAARLEGLNAGFGTSIVVTDAVREAAGPGFQVRTLGSIHDAGGRAAIRVYELCAEKGTTDALPDLLISEFEEGMRRYEKGDITGALAIFSRVLAAAPGDGPSAAYARRCRRLAAAGERRWTSPPCRGELSLHELPHHLQADHGAAPVLRDRRDSAGRRPRNPLPSRR